MLKVSSLIQVNDFLFLTFSRLNEKAPCMIGKPWRKKDTHGGYAAYDVRRIYMTNLGLTTLEDLLDIGLFALVSLG